MGELFENTDIPACVVRKFPNKKICRVKGHKNYAVVEDGTIVRIKSAQGTYVGKVLDHLTWGNSDIVRLYENGVGETIEVKRLVWDTFNYDYPRYVEERRIAEGTKNIIQTELTKMIIEFEDGNKKNCHYKNLRINFWPRGIRHCNHKLENDDILLIRQELYKNPNVTTKEIIKKFGHIGNIGRVTPQTIYNVIKANYWRVRVNPFEQKTYPMENFPGYIIPARKTNSDYELVA